MMAHDHTQPGGAHPHTCHARVAIGIHEINIPANKNVLIIRAARCEDQRAENYDFDESKAYPNHFTIPNPASAIGNPKFQVQLGVTLLQIGPWMFDVPCQRSGPSLRGVLSMSTWPCPISATKKREGRQNFKSAASTTLMSMSSESPDRFGEILLEILALSNSTRTSQSESARGADSIQSFDLHRVNEQSQRTEQGDNDRQRS
jgi:hypothetical protein